MECETRSWIILGKVRLQYTNSLRVEGWFWLEWLPGCGRSVMECFLDLETPCNWVFSFKIFCQKVAMCSIFWAQLFLFFSLGLCLHMYEEWIRLENKAQNPCIQCFWICDFHDLFQSFLAMEFAYFGRSCLLSMCTKYLGHKEWICCIKRFGKHILVFFLYLILIKWINRIINSIN